MDLNRELEETMVLLKAALKESKSRGIKRAQCESEYRIALSSRLTELRALGSPVTHLIDIAKGEREIAQLRLNRDVADVLYQSSQEAINVYKLRVRILEEQIKREWSS